MVSHKGRVLVTGGAGFIGSHLTRRLLTLGYSVTVIDNLSTGHSRYLPPDCTFIEADICDRVKLEAALSGCRTVYHLAAFSRVAPSIDAPEAVFHTNVNGTLKLLRQSWAAGVVKFIFAGSATYYGNTPAPNWEGQRPDLLNFYAVSKYTGEELCKLYTEKGMFCSVLRYFNVYGERQPGKGPYSLVLGKFLSAAAAGHSLEIHGPGHQRRDFVHVNDVVDATIAAGESDLHDTWNVGSGVATSILELASMISLNHTHTERRKGDSDSTCADLGRITRTLRWMPKVNLIDGIAALKQAYGIK